MSSAFADLAPPELIAKYEPVIGLEVHVQLATPHQDLLRLPDRFGAPPNTQRLPGLPGFARRAAGVEPRPPWNWR